MTVGIVLCDCGEKLAKIINYDKVSEALKGLALPIKRISNLCLPPGLDEIKKFVDSNSIDKLIVGACTPKFIEYKIKKAIPTLISLEFAILREHVAWPNKTDPEKATRKTVILLKTAAAAIEAKEKIDQEDYDVNKNVIIIGGGIAGIQAALDLGTQVNVTLLERKEVLGGNLLNLGKVFPGDIEIQEILKKKIEDLKNNANITIKTNVSITSIEGNPGAYEVTIEGPNASTETIKAGAIVIATGIEESKPYHLDLSYGKSQDIILQTDLARMLRDGKVVVPSTGEKPQTILIGNCINCRDENHFYCSKICCTYSIHHAMELLEAGIEPIICYMDIRAPYKYENIYREAREKGVTFIRGKLQSVEIGPDNEFIVPVENTLTNELYELNPDMIVLSSALIPTEGSDKLAELLGLKLKESAFISDLYSKTNPSQTTQRGIFLAGTAFTPMSIQETMAHASAAAVKTLKFLKEGTLTRELLVPTIDEELCIGCANCYEVCQFNAITMLTKTDTDEEIDKLAEVDPTKCKGCGTCSAVCPTGATQLANYQRGVIFTKIETLMKAVKEENWNEPVILALTCEECASCGVDIAGISGFEFPANVFDIDVPCAGRIGVINLLKAFVEGADAVLVARCPEKSCHFLFGSYNAGLTVEFTKNILDEIGFDSSRLVTVEMVSSDPDKYVKALKEINELISKIGQNPKK
ncbi:MAG: hydrogenase iron-sulfur subunit [Candidatus Helarchaeota archaeon]